MLRTKLIALFLLFFGTVNAEKTASQMLLKQADELSQSAEVYLEASNYTRAITLYEKALEIRKAELGDGNPITVKTINRLASLNHSLASFKVADEGYYAESVRHYKHALNMRKATLGEKHIDTLKSMENLADVYWEIGSNDAGLPYFSKAEALYKKALKERELFQIEHKKEIILLLRGLAGVHLDMGIYDPKSYRTSLELYQRTLALSLEVFDRNSWEVDWVKERIALVNRHLGE